MNKPPKFSPEVRERGARLVQEQSGWGRFRAIRVFLVNPPEERLKAWLAVPSRVACCLERI